MGQIIWPNSLDACSNDNKSLCITSSFPSRTPSLKVPYSLRKMCLTKPFNVVISPHEPTRAYEQYINNQNAEFNISMIKTYRAEDREKNV